MIVSGIVFKMSPKVTVFTPLSKTGNPYIEAAFETLVEQTSQDFEWVVLENHGGKLPKAIRSDPRVSCHGSIIHEGIGALKGHACSLARGEYLLELDHDDLLHPEAIEKAIAAFESEDQPDFVFSDTAEFHNELWTPNVYGTQYGWTSYPVDYKGHELRGQPQPPVTAHNLRLIDWAPNHFRAFRRSTYEELGGYNSNFPVADDHDLMLRFFLSGKRFRHIPECLYFYRVHAAQTVSQKNGLIRDLTEQLYDERINQLAEKFAEDSGLRKIDLCGAIDNVPGYEPWDLSIGHDLNARWPAEESTVGVIRAYDAIEHLKDPIHTMNEAYRVLAPGGFFLIRVPSTDGRGAFQDPTHVSFWNENSFWYYTKDSHARYVPRLKAAFQCTRLRTFFPNPGMAECKIPYAEAHLVALKPGYEPMGLVEMKQP